MPATTATKKAAMATMAVLQAEIQATPPTMTSATATIQVSTDKCRLTSYNHSYRSYVMVTPTAVGANTAARATTTMT